MQSEECAEPATRCTSGWNHCNALTAREHRRRGVRGEAREGERAANECEVEHGADRTDRALTLRDDARAKPSPHGPVDFDALSDPAETLGRAIRIAFLVGDKGATCRGLSKRTGVPHQRIHDWKNPRSPRKARLSAPEQLGLTIALVFYVLRAAEIRVLLLPESDELLDFALDLGRIAGAFMGLVRDARRRPLDDELLAAIEAQAHLGLALLSTVLAICARIRRRWRDG